jgi:hypothetical protein
MKSNENIGVIAISTVVVIGLVLGVMYVSRAFNAATLHTQVINPKPGIECVAVSASDSISVDCWESL